MRSIFAAGLLSTICTVGLGACTSVLVLPADVEIVPTKYHLGPADIRAIQSLPVAAGITKPLRSIQALSADRVHVTCGVPWLREAEMISFTAQRKNGHWLIDKLSINKYQPIIVE